MKTPEQTGPRLEMKFTLRQTAADELAGWLVENFQPDPHSPHADGAMEITTLYYDSPDRICYRGRARTPLPKHRLRQYDGKGSFYLEEKYRRGNQVWKRRIPIESPAVRRIFQKDESLEGELAWFRSRFRILDLSPSLLIRYRRRAFVSACGGRVTIDDGLRAQQVVVDIARDDPFHDSAPINGATAITADCIVEIKGPTEISNRMHEVIRRVAAQETPFSKYSRGLEAAGLETPVKEEDA